MSASYGGAIFVNGNSVLVMEYCNFERISSFKAGVIKVGDTSVINITDSSFINNFAMQ